jgi:hypothetical protein
MFCWPTIKHSKSDVRFLLISLHTVIYRLPDLLDEYDDLDRDLDDDLCLEGLPPGLLPTSSTTVIWLSHSSTFVSASLLSTVSSILVEVHEQQTVGRHAFWVGFQVQIENNFCLVQTALT